MLSAETITVKAGDKALVSNLSLSVKPGEVLALVGANGAGKSTTLKALCGEIGLAGGGVSLYGRPLGDWDAVDRAKKMAILPQSSSLTFALTVEEIVTLGQMPFEASMTRADGRRYIQEAMDWTEIGHLAHRQYPSLSGGERLRTHLSRVIAQVLGNGDMEGKILLLDEPTSNLDLNHQLRTQEIVRELAERGVGILAILHDLNLTMRFADNVCVLKGGESIALGPTRTVMTTDIIEAAFSLKTRMVEIPDFPHPTICMVDRITDDSSQTPAAG